MKRFLILLLLLLPLSYSISPNDDLLLYYPLSDNANDVWNNYDGISSGVLFEDGYANFTKNNTYIDTPDLSAFLDYKNESYVITLNTPVKVLATSSYVWSDKADPDTRLTYNNNPGVIRTSVRASGAPIQETSQINGSGDVVIVLTMNDTHFKVYRNGVLNNTHTIGALNIANFTNRLGLSGSGLSNYTYRMKDFSIWTKELSQSEIIDITQNGIIISPVSSNLTTPINLNSVLINLSSINSSGTYLNGNFSYSLNGGSYISIANNVNTTTFNLTGYSLGLNNVSWRFYNGSSNQDLNETFTFQPTQYFRIYDTQNAQYVQNFTFGDFTANGEYVIFNTSQVGLGNKVFNFSATGYIDQSVNVTFTLSSQYNATYNTSPAVISVTIRDKDTSNVITGENFTLEFIASVGLVTSTTTGSKNISNTLFQSEQYQLIVSSQNYSTESRIFDFTNQEILPLTVYVSEKNLSSGGTVTVKVYNSLTQTVEGAIVEALQWDSSSSSYISVSSALTDSSGEGELNIILDTKVYKFRASFNGQTSTTSQQTITTANNGATIPITIQGAEGSGIYILQNIIASATESFNNVTNISTVTFNFNNAAGTEITACNNLYFLSFTGESLINSTCTTSVSGQLVTAYFLNTSKSFEIRAELLINGAYYTVEIFRHDSKTSPSQTVKDYNFHYLIIVLLYILALGIGYQAENISLGLVLMGVAGFLGVLLTQGFFDAGVVLFLGVINSLTLWVVKE